MDYLKLNEEKLRKLCEDGQKGKFKLKIKEVSVQLTNRCNNYCVMCHYCDKKHENRTYFNEEPKDITLSEYKKFLPNAIIAWINSLKKSPDNKNFVYLTGESFLNKDIYEIVKCTKKAYPNCFIRFISNGTIPPKRPDIVKYIDKIAFSVDGCTNETFHYLRPPATLDHVVKTIAKWDEAASLYNDDFQLVFSTVVSAKNIHEIAGIVRLASQFKHMESIFVSPMYLAEPKKHLNHLLLKNIDDDVLEKEIEKIKCAAKETGVRVDNLNSLKQLKISDKNEGDGQNNSEYCRFFWNGIIDMTKNGLKGVCCNMEKFGADLIEKYNIPTNGTVDKIYNSKGYWQLRKDMLDGRLKNYCKYCELCNVGYKALSEKELNLDESLYA